MPVIYNENAIELVSEAISRLNRTWIPVDVSIGKHHDGGRATLYLEIGEDPVELDDELEVLEEGKVPLIFSLVGRYDNVVASGQWNNALVDAYTALPKSESDALARNLLDECSRQLQ